MSMTTTQQTEAYRFFNIAFGAAPGVTYMNQIAEAYAAGMTTKQIVNVYTTKPEFISVYPEFYTNEQFASKIIDTVVGASATAEAKTAAKADVVAALNSGYSRGDVVYQIFTNLASLTGDATWGGTALQLANKVTVAQYYTEVMLGNTTNLATLQAVVSGVTNTTNVSDPAAIINNTAAGATGQTFTLTAGADNIVGTSGNDTINATVETTGSFVGVPTLNSADVIDGGAGTDTLNINVADVTNFPLGGNTVQQGIVKNVEIININNGSGAPFAVAGIDASLFSGATQIWQKTAEVAVNNLGGSTTAGFRSIAAVNTFNVNSADAATAASVAFDGVQEGSTAAIVSGAAGTLNTVNVSGSVVDTNKDGTVGQTTVAVTVGKDVQTLTVNTGVNTLLVATNGAGKAIATVDASSSTGAVDYQTAAATVAAIKGGSGNDKLVNIFAGTATANAATLNGGAGDDTLTLNATVGAATAVAASVDGGEGKDTINVTINANVNYDVKGGAGDDAVVITGTVKTTDKIDGGDGVDSVGVAPTAATLIADDYIVFNKVLTNFETLKLTGVANNLDASKLAATYTTLDLFAGSTVDNVTTQAIVSNGALNAEASGYINVGEGSPAATAITYAGTLNITDKGLAAAFDAISAHADTVNLTVAGGKANAVAANNAVLSGEAKTATVTLSAGTDTKGTAVTTDDTFVASSVTVAQNASGVAVPVANELKALTSLTISGNGAAVVTVGDVTGAFTLEASQLVNVDASGLNSVDEKGAAVAGLTYVSANTAAETVKLGGGIDTVVLGASTYGKMDTVEGLKLVVAGGALTAASDTIDILTAAGASLDLVATGKMATTQTDLDLALKDAAVFKSGGVDQDVVAFQMGGNTYVYADTNGDELVDANDIVVKLTGTIDLDALVIAL